jgi:hypothetical protein
MAKHPYRDWVHNLTNHMSLVQDKTRHYLKCNYCHQEIKNIYGKKPKCKNGHFVKIASRNILSAMLSQAIPMNECRDVAGLHWAIRLRTRHFGDFIFWGKVPWQQFKNHPWWFTPILICYRWPEKKHA